MTRTPLLLTATFSLLIVAQSGAKAQVLQDRKSLTGIKGIGVWIKTDPDSLKEINLSLNQISTDTTLRLRKSGIRVLESREEQVAVEGYPHLIVVVSLLKTDTSDWIFNVSASLSQWVVLARNPNESLYLTTWNNAAVLGGANQEGIQDSIRKALGDVVDKFINDYSAANPK